MPESLQNYPLRYWPHQQIERMIHYCKEKGIKTRLSTTPDNLTRENIKKIKELNQLTIAFDGKLNKALSWLYRKSKKLDELKLFLQNEIEKKRGYIENIEVEIQDQDKGHYKDQDKAQIQYLTVQVYYPIEANDSFIESEIKILAEKWVKQCGFTVSNL